MDSTLIKTDSVEIVPVISYAFVFPFDIVKTMVFEGHHEEFLEAGYATRWHIDCEMPCQGTGKEVLSSELGVLS